MLATHAGRVNIYIALEPLGQPYVAVTVTGALIEILQPPPDLADFSVKRA